MNAVTAKMDRTFIPEEAGDRILRDAFGRFATGVTVITCDSDQGPVCIAANSFSSISLDPALLMWAADRNARRFPFFEQAEHFAVHVLSSAQQDLCLDCSKDAFALAHIPHGLNPNRVPLLEGCIARFECEKYSYHEAGDHVIVVGKVQCFGMEDGDALAFFAGKFGQFAQP